MRFRIPSEGFDSEPVSRSVVHCPGTNQGEKESSTREADPALATLPFNPMRCNCRVWNGGFGAQCGREKVGDDDLCSLHRTLLDKAERRGGMELPHGRYNGPRPDKKWILNHKGKEKTDRYPLWRGRGLHTSAVAVDSENCWDQGEDHRWKPGFIDQGYREYLDKEEKRVAEEKKAAEKVRIALAHKERIAVLEQLGGIAYLVN